MARKKVWLTWLPTDADGGQIQGLLKALGKFGLAVDGAIWNRDLARVGWSETSSRVSGEEPADLWLIVGNRSDFEDQAVRYGLSLAQAAVRSTLGRPLPTVVAGLDAALQALALPALLRGAQRLAPPWAGWGAQLVASASRRPPAADPEEFRLGIIAHPNLGQWFEVGPPAGAAWQGSIFGIDDGEITHQGVGPSGELPERCILEYPSQGIRVELDGRAFTCWAVRNTLDAGQSHYAKVIGSPGRILFGELPEQDEAELRVLDFV